ncbi:hypothetical protein NVP1211B_32 [Vibrio phage 1.211.B._10N.222.52.F11]|nr:hypothetical protein NVP1211A_32 [Vibrio phage 1.211.A._10N.222.52.F11]AUR95768.1 hypothetical protein NVP1211B_32 [Vibrio phage 1.211.B._10N.222.52.F11]
MNADRLAPEKTERRQSFRNTSSAIANYEVINMLTQQYLKSRLSYSRSTGVFTWKEKAGNSQHDKIFNSKFKNKVAGSLNEHGYIIISIDGSPYKAHRLAWLYVYGAFPEGEIDHLKGVKSDNRIEMLSDVTRFENSKNRPLQRNNKSGVVGVSWDSSRERWTVRLGSQGNYKFLGRFLSFVDACQARIEAEKENGFNECHGRVQR